MLEVVAGIVDEVPSDSVVKVEQDVRKESGTSSHGSSPSLPVQVSHVSKPVASTPRRGLCFAFIGPESGTGRVAARKGWFEISWDVQAWNFNGWKSNVGDNGPDDDSDSDGKVVNRIAYGLIAKISRRFEASEEEDGGSGPESQDDTEKGSLVHAVIGAKLLIVFMERVGRIQVSKKTTGTEWTSNRIQNEDGNNQEGKDIIGESV